MPADLNLEKRLAGLSPEARLRVETALKESLAKEGALAAFDRSGFDRGPYDRGGEGLEAMVNPAELAGKAAITKGTSPGP